MPQDAVPLIALLAAGRSSALPRRQRQDKAELEVEVREGQDLLPEDDHRDRTRP